jgi:hypothetical protein
MNYFSFDPEPVDELILATTNPDLIPLVRRVKRTRNARVRMWGSDDVLEGTEFADQVIFQPLETLLGIPFAAKRGDQETNGFCLAHGLLRRNHCGRGLRHALRAAAE